MIDDDDLRQSTRERGHGASISTPTLLSWFRSIAPRLFDAWVIWLKVPRRGFIARRKINSCMGGVTYLAATFNGE